MGQLHDSWKVAKGKIKKSEVAKKFTVNLGDALDKMETKRADLKRRLESIPDDRPLTQDEGHVIFEENNAIGKKAADIVADYMKVVIEARKKYKDELDKKKDKAKQEAKVKFDEMEVLIRALGEIQRQSGQMSTAIRTLIALKKGGLKKDKDGKIHVKG